jgi:threonine synthase
MNYYSTNNPGLMSTFEYAIFSGLAPDGGLWMPMEFPKVYNPALIKKDTAIHDVAKQLLTPFLSENFTTAEIESIIVDAFNFPIAMTSLSRYVSMCELFRGPTLAFKDFGARFMARVFASFAEKKGMKLVILVATSGDTGSAVASGFHNVPNTDVVILYPKGKVSRLQELQLTTYSGNVKALRVDGTFDDCQRLVKMAFSDRPLREMIHLTSANSINIARLLPQMVYYGYASYLIKVFEDESPVIAVPSGNLGNVTAGLMAKRMGFPIEKFVIGTNVNRAVPDFFEFGIYEPKSSIQTISNAMDVGDPSNFSRIKALYNGDLYTMKKDIAAYSITDIETEQNIRFAYDSAGYVSDPHTAVGLAALRIEQSKFPGSRGIVMSTAHPSKFPEVVQKNIDRTLVVHEALESLEGKPQEVTDMNVDYLKLRDLLMSYQSK